MKLTTKYLLMLCSVVFAVNMVMGFVVARQSKSAMMTLIHQRMLDISNTAAASLDGDVLKSIDADSKGSDAYNEIIDTLELFQDNVDLEYIYTIQDMGNDQFGFIVDADPIDPGAYGETIVTTDALIKASKGTPAVDEEAFTDSWGRFYSSYSPVYDSAGELVGIVGVDFDAQWLEDQVAKQNMSIILISAAAIILGAALVLAISRKTMGKIRELYDEMSSLTEDVEKLNTEIVNNPDYKGLVADSGVDQTDSEGAAETPDTDISSDAIGALAAKLKAMHTAMSQYLSIVHKQAYADTLTGLGNRTAYSNSIRRINIQIAEGTAGYSIILFDIDNMKAINDERGHEYGDRIIYDIATVLKDVYGTENLYRVRDDGFTVISGSMTLKEIEETYRKVDAGIYEYNTQLNGFTVSVSRGAAVHRPGIDEDFRDTFRRADEELSRSRRA